MGAVGIDSLPRTECVWLVGVACERVRHAAASVGLSRPATFHGPSLRSGHRLGLERPGVVEDWLEEVDIRE